MQIDIFLVGQQHILLLSGTVGRRKMPSVTVGDLHVPPCTTPPPSSSLTDDNDCLVSFVFLASSHRIQPSFSNKNHNRENLRGETVIVKPRRR
ncbi:4-diphosphocytidyl-2C-methyl-D-erythritol kinase [Sesbania bispinosa]|nr:4-diphosphocytidyl-2C-methyl-D-erythritol kinase [Sesbania bispinosa]